MRPSSVFELGVVFLSHALGIQCSHYFSKLQHWMPQHYNAFLCPVLNTWKLRHKAGMNCLNCSFQEVLCERKKLFHVLYFSSYPLQRVESNAVTLTVWLSLCSHSDKTIKARALRCYFTVKVTDWRTGRPWLRTNINIKSVNNIRLIR